MSQPLYALQHNFCLTLNIFYVHNPDNYTIKSRIEDVMSTIAEDYDVLFPDCVTVRFTQNGQPTDPKHGYAEMSFARESDFLSLSAARHANGQKATLAELMVFNGAMVELMKSKGTFGEGIHFSPELPGAVDQDCIRAFNGNLNHFSSFPDKIPVYLQAVARIVLPVHQKMQQQGQAESHLRAA